MKREASALPKYPTGSLGFSLFEKIGDGAFAQVYRALVCEIEWKTFEQKAKEAEIDETTIKALEEKGFKDRPQMLLELTRQSICSFYGRDHNVPDSVRLEDEKKAQGVLDVVKSARKETTENVALKILNSEHANWDDIRNELATMRSMNHENVVRVYSAFVNEQNAEDPQELWIVMPLLAVGSCSSILKEDEYKKGIKDPKILATILKKVLKALAYFHKDGRIHRDVKAGNILLSENGEVKLADFGVSANTIEHGSRDVTRKTFVGTPCWMAPEVMEQRSGYNTKADIWSFGITAMELAYGYAPYAHEQAMKVLVLTLKNPPPTCEVYDDYNNPKFPKEFHKMIARCLDKNPANRPDAKKMLSHSFFRLKQNNNFLVDNLIKKVMEARKKRAPSTEMYADARPKTGKNISKAIKVDTWELKGEALDTMREERDKMKAEKEEKSSEGNEGEDGKTQGDRRGRFKVGPTANTQPKPAEKKKGRFIIKDSQEVDKSIVDQLQKGRFKIKKPSQMENVEEQKNETQT
mmetsp:Transcript_20595/g.50528  ORF Transcript_20595/g.50528 Transcript_20595/m.50528 type:complete len:523 (-) Transcript_20595:580-2148(-)